MIRKERQGHNPIKYKYDAQNMLREIEEQGVRTTSNYYDESGQRFLKIHKETGQPDIRTFYLSGDFEYREKWSSGSSTRAGYQISKSISGAGGQRIASITGEVEPGTSMALMPSYQPERYYALADFYSSTSLMGLVYKSEYLFKGLALEVFHFADSLGYKLFYLVFMLVCFFILLIAYLRYLSLDAEERAAGFLAYGGRLLPHFSPVLVFMLLFVYSCGSSHVPNEYQSAGTNRIYDGLPSGTHYYSNDHLGSSTLITDESGNEVIRTKYTPYGEIDLIHTGKYDPNTNTLTKNAETDPEYSVLGVRFTDQKYDPESSLYYYNARYYDPSIGVFTTADTIVPDSFDPLAYNRYMYVRGNPIIYTDPTGHFWGSSSEQCPSSLNGRGGSLSCGVYEGLSYDKTVINYTDVNGGAHRFIYHSHNFSFGYIGSPPSYGCLSTSCVQRLIDAAHADALLARAANSPEPEVPDPAPSTQAEPDPSGEAAPKPRGSNLVWMEVEY